MKGSVQKLVMDRNNVIDSSGVYLVVHEGHPMSDISIIKNNISNGKNGIIQDEYGRGALNGLQISGNQVSETKEMAIEIIPDSTPPKNVSIEDNVLTNNARNFIIVPESIQTSLKNNVYNKSNKRR